VEDGLIGSASRFVSWCSESDRVCNIRLKVKRSAKRKPQAPIEIAEPTSRIDTRPAKRLRKEDPSAPKFSEPNSASAPSGSTRSTQFISSLFTSNPKIDVPKPEKSTHKPPLKPSNAPLDASSFSGLGLNPLLVSHLTSKMNISKPTAIQKSALASLLSPSNDSKERDAFIQCQTGSGKTLAYLLPIIHDLLPLGSLSYIDRSVGTLAIIIAPTRELAKQISDVLESLLKLRLRAEDESADDPDPVNRLSRWLVSGLLIGGENRTHEKARLRKGLPILVTTPGRLLDHLQNTSSFNVGKCRWLVLDEADRLMELGFEETISSILKGLEGRHRLAKKAVEEGKSMEVGGWDWERRRRTILCSATMRENVQKLAGTALIDPLIIKAVEFGKDLEPLTSNPKTQPLEKFIPPSQLTQRYIVAPLKLRLVTLVALLRSLIGQRHGQSTRIIVFFSSTDSVDFHWNLLAGASMDGGRRSADGGGTDEEDSTESEGNQKLKVSQNQGKLEVNGVECPLLPCTSIYRLHGSLSTQARLSIVKNFAEVATSTDATTKLASILLCTSVASRGLDLPLVRAVVQYDLPTEGGVTEYVHRVGRTARAGKGGEAWSIVAPSETLWVQWMQEKMEDSVKSDGHQGTVSLTPIGIDEILRSGFGGKGQDYEDRATEVQLAFERWVLCEKEVSACDPPICCEPRAH
jgi:ATP-dependent RNA helicase DDX31/DBP7